jgi:tRNA threonylcarbamoyladenosine biosynthesis protein TsaB
MMIVLGIETATPVRGVGLVNEERELGERITHGIKADSEILFNSLDFLLNEHDIDLNEIDGISVSIGPGSFTGLRVGLALAKGLAQVRGCPLVAVPTLDALAEEANPKSQIPNPKLNICPVLDARKREVYGAMYREKEGLARGSLNMMERVSDYRVLSPGRLFDEIESESKKDEEFLFIGTGVEVYRDLIVDHFGVKAHFLTPNPLSPAPVKVAALGLQSLKRGEVEDVNYLEPLYIRPSQVEVIK